MLTNLFTSIVQIIRRNMRAYLVINAIYYGLVIAGMIYVIGNPGLQETLLDAVGQSFSSEGPLAAVGEAYGGGTVLNAMLLTFVVNLFLGSFVFITLPSLIVPFSGLLMGVYRASLWGLLLSPSKPELLGPMIPHSLTLLLEGQAYIVAMLGVYVLGKALIRPETVGESSHWRGYLAGLKATGVLYVAVTGLLAVAAVYEALEVIYLAPLF
jgi:hypothetical protein